MIQNREEEIKYFSEVASKLSNANLSHHELVDYFEKIFAPSQIEQLQGKKILELGGGPECVYAFSQI
jgi:hypothetical protein